MLLLQQPKHTYPTIPPPSNSNIISPMSHALYVSHITRETIHSISTERDVELDYRVKTYTHAHTHTHKQSYRQRDKTDRHRQGDTKRHRHTDTQTHRHTDTQTIT
jgi:hypothetical protein